LIPLDQCQPTDASAPFNLGNMLRAASRIVEAEAALRAATRANPEFAEAWYNLADLLDDQGRSEAAVECLRKALLVAPDYLDAMFNLALLLQRKGSYVEAADYWRRYLVSDRASEWATIPQVLRDSNQLADQLPISGRYRPRRLMLCSSWPMTRSRYAVLRSGIEIANDK
jgi:tetratricopeptide (TPR) repeat protein